MKQEKENLKRADQQMQVARNILRSGVKPSPEMDKVIVHLVAAISGIQKVMNAGDDESE